MGSSPGNWGPEKATPASNGYPLGPLINRKLLEGDKGGKKGSEGANMEIATFHIAPQVPEFFFDVGAVCCLMFDVSRALITASSIAVHAMDARPQKSFYC